ncbi:MAG: tRNA modification GTPase MnmE [bacterium ADurb.Bin236]|nr:MAG: tRNA modification GTPase MnmE [bacterium ADurb.Bin236]HOY61652.1 tRNA uridine-5-carboxymethylaminomethyl(34) synthesis GTPase MnmE [bacterium]
MLDAVNSNIFDKRFGDPDDTIAAVATPRGSGAVGIVRISGPDAVSVVAKLFSPASPSAPYPPPPRSLSLGLISDPASGSVIDQALVAFFPAPNSYTGDDVLEIYCHGGSLVTREILSAAVSAGARPALNGEFTCRAFLNGKLDLTQAESVNDIISSRNRPFLLSAVNQLSGFFGKKIKTLRSRLVDTLASIEVVLEYPEDNIDNPNRTALLSVLRDSVSELRNIMGSSASAHISNEPFNVVLIGKPNVGKSSLLNRMLDRDRAIVSDIPGTTRDVVSDLISTHGLDFLICDTAGITKTKDIIESIGVKKTIQASQRADAIIAVFDGSSDFDVNDSETISIASIAPFSIAVINKSDLAQSLNTDSIYSAFPKHRIISASAKTGDGIPAVYEALLAHSEELFSFSADAPIINERNKISLLQSISSLEDCLLNVDSAPDDILCVDLRAAIEQLGLITGENATNDILASVFANFCVGK